MKKTDISIIIPVLNEGESLTPLISSIDKTMKDSQMTYEYVWIDDGSTDKTFEILKEFHAKSKIPFHIIKFRKNVGKSGALAAGFLHASGDILVTLDADLQDDPKDIPHMIQKLSEGYDMIVGWRVNRQDHHRKIRLSRIFNFVVSKVTGVRLHDMNCGLKVFKKSVAEEIELYGELHRFIPVLASLNGFRVTEIPVTHHSRKYGVSKFGSGRIVHASFDLITTLFLSSFKMRPLQIFGPIGLGFGFIGMVFLIYLSILHFLGQTIGRRPLLQLGILFVLFGVQLFSTGLIGEMITSISANKARHPIEEVIS